MKDRVVHGSIWDERTCTLIENYRHRRRKCSGCSKLGKDAYATHHGAGSGVVLMSGCEWHVRKWVKKP